MERACASFQISFLIHCKTAANTVKYLKVLDDADENQRMVRKLPRYLTERWCREVERWRNNEEEGQHHGDGRVPSYLPFSVFCRLLQRESRIACNPVTTVRPKIKEVVKEDSDKGRKSNGFNKRRRPKFSVFATDSHEVADGNASNRKGKKSEATPCPLCKAPHDLDVCKQFLKKTTAERMDVIKANALSEVGTYETKLPKKTSVQNL